MFGYRLYIVFTAVFLLFFVCELNVEARNPPPTFETDYTLPITQTPPPSLPIVEGNAFIVGLYAVFLLIAGLAVHRWRSRKTLIALAVCAVALFGFFWQGCPCPVGMFQNLVHALVDPAAVVSLSIVLLFVLPLLAALFWGRIFCSAVCPLGALQELTAIKNLKISDRFEQIFGLFRFFVLGIGVFCVVVGLGYVLCQYDPFVGFFRLSGLYSVLVFSAIVLSIGFFYGRPFCRFLCPYGALLGICGSLASRKVSVTPGQCDQCKLCENVCPYNAILPPTTEPAPQEKRASSLKLMGTILALPILIFVFAQIGGTVAPRLVTWNLDFRTGQLLHAEEERWVLASGTFPETRGIIQVGRSSEDVYQDALRAYQLFHLAGVGLGSWIGLVIGVKWISLMLRRRRIDYEVAPSRCFACGRCFWYCPNQKGQRLLLIENTEPERG